MNEIKVGDVVWIVDEHNHVSDWEITKVGDKGYVSLRNAYGSITLGYQMGKNTFVYRDDAVRVAMRNLVGKFESECNAIFSRMKELFGE